ncbi:MULTISPECIES: BlaI/MecI/CopY family transcriptional regulator [Parafrankia]|uniref:BlaI/MecI/CopY family transcriptional regulator n=1 Tax=Parafrankia TaxID=2994362 RepID=UPI000A85FEBE|nr:MULTISPECIES: BlaI/MecI/CopY family transcriptional regulator [Parafrankia]
MSPDEAMPSGERRGPDGASAENTENTENGGPAGADAERVDSTGRSATGRRARGSLETEIVDILAQSGGALSPAQVRARLPGSIPLSYSTVVTILTRLHAKGLVTRHRDGRAYRYAAGDPAAAAARRMTRLLDDQADHRVALAHFLAALSPGDEALLRSLITESDE